jgi:hypothetical protein
MRTTPKPEGGEFGRGDLNDRLVASTSPIADYDLAIPERLDRSEGDGVIVSDNYVEGSTGFRLDRRTGEVEIEGDPTGGLAGRVAALEAAIAALPAPTTSMTTVFSTDFGSDINTRCYDYGGYGGFGGGRMNTVGYGAEAFVSRPAIGDPDENHGGVTEVMGIGKPFVSPYQIGFTIVPTEVGPASTSVRGYVGLGGMGQSSSPDLGTVHVGILATNKGDGTVSFRGTCGDGNMNGLTDEICTASWNQLAEFTVSCSGGTLTFSGKVDGTAGTTRTSSSGVPSASSVPQMENGPCVEAYAPAGSLAEGDEFAVACPRFYYAH